MICQNCGKENPEGNAVCFSCGEPLAGTSASAESVTTEQVVAAVQAQPTAQPTAEPTAQPTTQAAQQATEQPTPAQQTATAYTVPTTGATSTTAGATNTTAGTAGATNTTGAPAYTASTQATAPTAPAQPTYAKGCIGCAWDDIKQSNGWIGRTLLLGLINLVPILNWVVNGYCMRWARQLSMGRIESMPKQIFGNRCFVNGAFYFVLSLVISLIAGIAGGIVGLVPLLGWLAAIAISVFLCMFLNAATMRTAIADRLGAGFDVSTVWNALKKNPGSLLCITIVPGIIIGIIVSIVALIILAIAGVAMSGNIYDLIMMSSYYDSYAPYDYYSYGHHGYGDASGLSALMAMMGIVGAMAPALLLIYIITCFATAFQTLLVYRAMGHWTARYANDWMNDPSVTSTMNMYPDPQPVQSTPPVQPQP